MGCCVCACASRVLESRLPPTPCPHPHHTRSAFSSSTSLLLFLEVPKQRLIRAVRLQKPLLSSLHFTLASVVLVRVVFQHGSPVLFLQLHVHLLQVVFRAASATQNGISLTVTIIAGRSQYIRISRRCRRPAARRQNRGTRSQSFFSFLHCL